MINLHAWYRGAHVVLKVPNNNLVFDGLKFVAPSEAVCVMLVEAFPTVAVDPLTYHVQEIALLPVFAAPAQSWVCRIVSIDADDGTTSSADVVCVDDPRPNGRCICGVTCFGTQILSVPITQGN